MRECQKCKNCFSDEVNICPNDGMPTLHTISGEPVLEGKYHLESRLGQGGMGVVYAAKHAYLKTKHAIKAGLGWRYYLRRQTARNYINISL